MPDELFGIELELWLQGWKDASERQPLKEDWPIAYLLGFEDFHVLRAGEADQCLSVH